MAWGCTLQQLKADIVADLNKPLPIESEVTDTVILAISLLMRDVWAIDQCFASLLVKYWKSESDTAGYFVVAKKL